MESTLQLIAQISDLPPFIALFLVWAVLAYAFYLLAEAIYTELVLRWARGLLREMQYTYGTDYTLPAAVRHTVMGAPEKINHMAHAHGANSVIRYVRILNREAEHHQRAQVEQLIDKGNHNGR